MICKNLFIVKFTKKSFKSTTNTPQPPWEGGVDINILVNNNQQLQRTKYFHELSE